MTKPSQLLIATRNAGKIREIEQLLAGQPLALRGLAEFPQIPEAEETGETFTENALLKARFYAGRSGLWALADDSGLEVAALDGRPGVFSARYGGAGATYAQRIAKLLGELESVPDPAARRARFVCVIAIAPPDGEDVHTFDGTCEGRIADAPRGSNGFGYDPVFVPDGHEQTFGELTSEVKQRLSHRARALAQACRFLRERGESIA